MEKTEILEGKKIDDNLEDTSASEEVEKEKTETEIPNLATAPKPTEEEVDNANLAVEPTNEVVSENEEMKVEGQESESAPIENVEKVEENGVTEMPATKSFTQSQVNEMVGSTRTETREKTFRYIYDRYGVKDEAELDELVGNAQALDSFKEKYETEKADWKKTNSERDAELQSVKEQVALLQSGIDKNRFDDAKFILKGKGLEVSLENIENELSSHPEWKTKKEVETDGKFVKMGEAKDVDTNLTEPDSKITVLGNESAPNKSESSEEDFVMNRMFKV